MNTGATELRRRHQLVLLEMLKEFDRICRRHDIPYMLFAGTALGAQRHGGFIPWDDDVDLGMPKEDDNISSKLFCFIKYWSCSTTWREPLMWQEEPIHTVTFIFFPPKYVLFVIYNVNP